MCDLICQKKACHKFPGVEILWHSLCHGLRDVSKFLYAASCAPKNECLGSGEKKSQFCSSLLSLGWENWQQKFSLGLWMWKLPLFLKRRGKLSMSSFPLVIWNVSEGHEPLNIF